MLQYKGRYMKVFPVFLRRYLAEEYGREITGKALKKAPAVYRDMLRYVDDIGADNPMAPNIYMSLVFLAVWKASDGTIDLESYRTVIRRFVKSPAARIVLGGHDINRPRDREAMRKNFHAMRDWADAHPQYRDRTWDFHFDDTRHRDGICYHFTVCPMISFARRYGCLEALHVCCCDIDFLTAEASHGVLHREHNLVDGDSICDYWIVPDRIRDPK